MFYNKIIKKENNKYGQMKLKIKKLRRKNHVKKQKGYNPNRISSNNACPLSITIKVSNINGWEYR